MSKVLDLKPAGEVVDYCSNPECGREIMFGEPVWPVGHELCCTSQCLIKKLGAVTVIAGREVRQVNEHNRKSLVRADTR